MITAKHKSTINDWSVSVSVVNFYVVNFSMVNFVIVEFGLADFDISVIGMGDFYSRDCDLGISDINVRFGLVNFLS